MAATKFFIIYAATTKAIRRIIYPDDDNQQFHVGDGEDFIACPNEQRGDLFQWKSLVEKATGVYPPDPLCAVVHPKDGTVLGMIMADPNLDTHPSGHDLVDAYSDQISVGDSFDKAQGIFIKSAYVIEEYIDKSTLEVVPRKEVPAAAIQKPS